MKILAVENVSNVDTFKKQFIEQLLKKNIENDAIFENTFINIDIEEDRPINFLYRLLWEHRYLRRKNNDSMSYKDSESTYTLRLSISEAKQYIQRVLPPIFKDRIHEAYNSLESLVETLRVFLKEGDANDLLIFQKVICWNPFETYMTYDKNRMKMLRKFHPTGLIVDVEVSTCDFNKLYNDDVYETDQYVQVMFSCHTQKQLQQLINDVIDQDIDLKLLTVFSDNDGYFIEFSIGDITSPIPKELVTLIQTTYKPLVG